MITLEYNFFIYEKSRKTSKYKERISDRGWWYTQNYILRMNHEFKKVVSEITIYGSLFCGALVFIVVWLGCILCVRTNDMLVIGGLHKPCLCTAGFSNL